MTDPGTTLGDVIHQRTAELPPAERRVARTLFASNLMAGFDTVADLADHVLTVDVDAPSPYDTLVPCIAPVEAPVARGIVGRLGDATHRRLRTFENLREGYTWDDREFPQHPEERGP